LNRFCSEQHRQTGLKKRNDVDVLEEAIFLILPTESIISTIENYKKCVERLFDYLKYCPEPILKPIILDISNGTVKEDQWKVLVDGLSANLELFKKITYLDLADCPLSLKQLIDCHSLFKQCEDAGIPFPTIDIQLSQAARQIMQKEAINEDISNDYSEKDLKKLTIQQTLEFIDSFKEPIIDISKEDFLKSISNSKGVDTFFLQKIIWLEDKSLYDSLSEENGLSSLDFEVHVSHLKKS